MSDASEEPLRAVHSAQLVFNWPLVQQRCRDRGATTPRAAARLMGIGNRTLDRLRAGSVDPRVGTIERAAATLGIHPADMFIRQQRDDVAA